MFWQIHLAALLVSLDQLSVAAEDKRSVDDNQNIPLGRDNVSADDDGWTSEVDDADVAARAEREQSFTPTYTDYSYPQFSKGSQDSAEDILFPSGAQAKANVEGSEIVEPAFVVPEEFHGSLPLPPSPDLPRKTYALTVSDGQVNHKDIRKDNGEYIFSYSTVDGSRRAEVGSLVTAANGQKVLVQRGSYAYTTRDGQMFQVDYQADTRGFRILRTKPLGGRRRVRPRPGQLRPLKLTRPSSTLTAGTNAKEGNKPSEAKPVYKPFLIQNSRPAKNYKPIDIALPISNHPFRKPSENGFAIDKQYGLHIYPFSSESPTEINVDPKDFSFSLHNR